MFHRRIVFAGNVLGVAALVFVASTACDSEEEPSPSNVEWQLAEAYVAPDNGPESTGSVHVSFGDGAPLEAAFEVTVDDGSTFQSLPILDTSSAEAAIDGNVVSSFPANEDVELTWSTRGLARDTALYATLRITVNDGEDEFSSTSPTFALDNVDSTNAPPEVELLDPNGAVTDFPHHDQIGTGTWTVRATDPDPFDVVTLTVTFDEEQSVFGAAGTDPLEYLDEIQPPLAGTPPQSEVSGNAFDGVEIDLSRFTTDAEPADYRLFFHVVASDGQDETQETLILGPSSQARVFALHAGQNMLWPPAGGTEPVYDVDGEEIDEPTAWEAVVSDTARELRQLPEGDLFDLVLLRSSTTSTDGFVTYEDELITADESAVDAAIAWLYSQQPDFGSYDMPGLEHILTHSEYSDVSVVRLLGNGIVLDAGDVEDDLPPLLDAKPADFLIAGTQVTGSSLMSYFEWIGSLSKAEMSLRE